jgi:ribosomal protein S18 acetylase RimI-like enzyme
MTRWQIREAVPDDAPEICSVAEAGWRATYGDILATETIDAAMAEWYDEDGVRNQSTDETVGYFVAEQDGVVAYCSGGDDDGTGYLGAIYVDPGHQRSGIGTALLECFERWARERGCAELRIEVIADNEAGRSFYEERGYRLQHREERELFGEEISVAIVGGPLDG